MIGLKEVRHVRHNHHRSVESKPRQVLAAVKPHLRGLAVSMGCELHCQTPEVYLTDFSVFLRAAVCLGLAEAFSGARPDCGAA